MWLSSSGISSYSGWFVGGEYLGLVFLAPVIAIYFLPSVIVIFPLSYHSSDSNLVSYLAGLVPPYPFHPHQICILISYLTVSLIVIMG